MRAVQALHIQGGQLYLHFKKVGMSLYGKSMVVSVGKHLIGEVIFRRVWSRVIGSVCSVEKGVGEARSRFSWRLVGNRGDFLEWRPRTQRQ